MLQVSFKYLTHPTLSCHYAIIPVVSFASGCSSLCWIPHIQIILYPLRTVQISPLQKSLIWPLQLEAVSFSSPVAVACTFYGKLDLFLVHLELFICTLSPHSDCNLEVRSHEFSPCPQSADVVPKVDPYVSEGLSKTSVTMQFLKSLPVQFRSLILNYSV